MEENGLDAWFWKSVEFASLCPKKNSAKQTVGHDFYLKMVLIYSLCLSFIYWFNLCKSNLYLRAPEFMHTVEIQHSTWSQFSIIQWLVPQSSTRIIHASGYFSFLWVLAFWLLCLLWFFSLRINSDGAPGASLLQPYLQILSFQLLTKSVFLLKILSLMSHTFSFSVISQFIASWKSATCLDAGTRLLYLKLLCLL